MKCEPLRRNRDYMPLWSAEILSELGSQTSAVAYPLLILALTGSAAVTFLCSMVSVSCTRAAFERTGGRPVESRKLRADRRDPPRPLPPSSSGRLVQSPVDQQSFADR